MEEKFRPSQMLEISVCEVHSDSLWVGPSGDPITVGGGGQIFPHLFRQALGPTQPPVQRVTGYFPAGKAARTCR